MTGMYNVRNYTAFGVLDRGETAFAHLLKESGYATCIAGKWQLGRQADAPQHFGFDQACLWQHTIGGAKGPHGTDNRFANPQIDINGKTATLPEGSFGPDVCADFICDFMETNQDKPFFVYYPMVLTHCPFAPVPDSADWDPKSKGSPTYEGGIREPLIVKWPGVTESGSTCSVPVVSTDFFPTFVQIAGGDPGKTTGVDGQSLVPLLKGASTLKPRALYWHFPHRKPLGNSGAIRKGQFKLIENFTTGEVELYDLSEDIGEKTDLSKQMPDKAGELLTELIAWRKELNATLPMNYDD